MSRIKNKSLYSRNPEQLKFWAEESEYIGRPFKLDLKGGRVILYALPPQKKKAKKEDTERRKKDDTRRS